MQQDSVDIISEQSINFCGYNLPFHVLPFLFFTLYNQIKTTIEIYDDKLASDFYYEAIQL